VAAQHAFAGPIAPPVPTLTLTNPPRSTAKTHILLRLSGALLLGLDALGAASSAAFGDEAPVVVGQLFDVLLLSLTLRLTHQKLDAVVCVGQTLLCNLLRLRHALQIFGVREAPGRGALIEPRLGDVRPMRHGAGGSDGTCAVLPAQTA
jgi:hypothetical protein